MIFYDDIFALGLVEANGLLSWYFPKISPDPGKNVG